MKTIAICQARMGSTRFPGKVMKLLFGKSVIRWVYDAMRATPGVDEVIIATSTLAQDDTIAKYCEKFEISCFRGSESDVLDRFYQCALQYASSHDDLILRITCDCPFIDPYVAGQVIELCKSTGASYASNQPTWPDGLDVECFTFAALEAAWNEATRPSDRDCVTQFIIRNQTRFPAEYLVCPFPGAHKERWVLDTEKDFELCYGIAENWHHPRPPTYMDIIRILDARPELRKVNAGAIRNERFYDGLAGEPAQERQFKLSNAFLAHATQKIPLGSQTFSKSHLFYPGGAAPLYVTHGDGARIFDVDGNDYVDLVGALHPIVLGYRDPDVDDAVRRQLNRAGMSFSLATSLEIDLADVLCDLIPCAEMVRFGKTGTDVTTAAVRLARVYTSAKHVLVGGYHGWADWSISTQEDKNFGIPTEIQDLTYAISPDNPQAIEEILDRLRGDIAAIVVEPTGWNLGHLRNICDKNDIVLIFDEIQTGFRYTLGGAQKWYGVTPDLACFGKAMGNGMPISALVGRKEIMGRLAPPDVAFFSGTFFGDTLSIAAALATIEKLDKNDIISHNWVTGVKLIDEIRPLLPNCVQLHGPGCLTKIKFLHHQNATAPQLQALFTQEMAQQGVLALNAHALSYAHKEPEIRKIVSAYKHTIAVINECLEKQGEINQRLKGAIAGVGVR